ncbi:MAG: WD40 repeat domain-containing protein, partial [Pirellulales bacterium]
SAIVHRLPSVSRLWRIVWHPSAARLALAGDAFVQVRSVETGELLWQKDLVPSAWRSAAWRPDGTTLAVADGDSVSVWDVKQDKQVGRLDKPGGGVNFAFNPAGTLLATGDWGSVLRLFDPLTGRQVFSTYTPIDEPQFSADGRFLAASRDERKLRIWEIAAGNEYRTLVASPLLGTRDYGWVAISATARFLAAGASGGIALWDLPTGKELAFLQDSPFNIVAFANSSPPDDVTGAEGATLLAMQSKGLFRLPVRADKKDGAVSIGPGESLGIPAANTHFAQSCDGRVLVSAQGWGAVVRHADQPDKLIKLEGHDDVRHVAVSPDGQWVATGRFWSPSGVKIWKLNTSADGIGYEFVKDLPTKGLCLPIFSPDGKRLLVSSEPFIREIRRFDAESWCEIPFDQTIDGGCATFSPDSKLIVLEAGSGVARLIDAVTGREYARLEDPNQHRTMNFAFTRDGATLVCVSGEGHCVHVWDLTAIRRQLAEMGLDWESP